MALTMSTKIAVIGSGGEWSALPVVRELGKKSHKCYILFQDLKIPVAYSKYLTGKYSIPKELDNLLIETINDICRKRKITHIICLNEELKYFLIKNKKKLNDLKYAFPPYESYDIAVKKDKSSAFVENLGIPVPPTKRIKKIYELDKLEFNFNKPVVIKGVRGVSSNHVRYALNFDELHKFYNEIYNLEKEDKLADSLPIIQEYIGGPTYLTQGLAQNGEVKVVVPHVKLREWPLSGGVTSRAKTINEPKLIEYTKKIMEELNWHGEAGMEWKYDEEKKDYYFLEMNPRFEGSLDIAVKAGVNMPNLLLKVMNSENIPNDIKFKSGTHYRWFFTGDFKYFLHKPYGWLKLFWESINPKVHGEFTIDDPGILRAYWKVPIREFISYFRYNKILK